MKQCASHVLMIRPASFQFNEQTAASNDYQNQSNLSKEETIIQAQEEFDNMVEILEQNNIIYIYK